MEKRLSSLPGEARDPGAFSGEPRLKKEVGWRLDWLWNLGLCSRTWYLLGSGPLVREDPSSAQLR